MLRNLENSIYGILGSVEKIEVERIVSKDNGNTIFQIRARNNSRVPVKIFSFLVAEFITQEKVENVLEHGWLQCSEVAYKSLQQPTKESRVFLQRDQNHFSFKEEYGYLENSIISEWFTVIKTGNKDLVIGAITTADMFSQIFVKEENGSVRIRVTCQYDGLILKPGEVLYSEKIFFGEGKQSVLEKQFAESLAKHMDVKKVAPPIRAMCNSYYWNGNKISEESINKELEALETLPEKLNLDYFQIDAGYTKYFGDWLSYKERFPNGFEPIIKRIKKLGYKPAIWLSPFAISPATKLHDHHPGWLLKGDHKKHFEGRWTSPFDNLSPDIDLEVLDPTHPEVKEYLTKVLTHFKDLGFSLFKIDFMYPVCLSEKFYKSVTRAQALREGITHIRKVLGDDSLILTCITQLSPMVGLADYVRTGIDTLNPFVCGVPGINRMVNEFMLEKNIRESEARLFMNGVVWTADPDMLIFREGTGIDKETIEAHKKFAKDNHMSLWIGDSVAGLDEDGKRNLSRFFNSD